MEKIKIDHVTKIFGPHPEKATEMIEAGEDKHTILEKTGQTVGVKDVTFSIDEGQIFVIMGLSGSGKSTLIRMINRLIRPTSGHIYIDGDDVTEMDSDALRALRQNKVAMVFQNFGLLPHKTVLENAGYGLRIRKLSDEVIRKKAQEAIDTVGLSGYENSFPDELSGGMQQRVGLARALATDSGVLLMDEAFSALDPLIRKDMQDELLAIQEDIKKTIVFITHDLNEALKIGDRIAIMRDGEVIQVGSPEEILTNPANEYVERFIEDASISKVLTAGQIMREAYAVAEDRGPRVALQLMRKYGVSDLFVTSKRREVLGIIDAKSALQALESRNKDMLVTEFMSTDVPTVSSNTTIEEAIEVAATTSSPIAVIDNQKKLLGAVVKGTLLSALSGTLDDESAEEAGGASVNE